MNHFNLPMCMSVKEGALNEVDSIIGSCIPNLVGKKAIIVTDEVLKKLYDNEISSIRDKFNNCKVYFAYDGSFDQAVELAKYICIRNIEVVIGFGGGKVLDIAKYASFVAKAKYFCIPTTLSHDGIASPIAVLNTDGDSRKSFGCKIPTGIIVDVDIIAKAPQELLKSGIGDTLSNYTALFDWKLDQKKHKQRANDFAYMLSSMSFDLLYYNEEKSLKSKSFIRMMSQSLVLSGLAMEIAGNSRPCSGAEHLFSHSLDENYKEIKISHGMAVALGSVVVCILQKRDYRLLLNYLSAYNISIQPMQWGITKEIFINAWLSAKDTRKDRYTILNEVDLTPELLGEIYDMIQNEDYEN